MKDYCDFVRIKLDAGSTTSIQLPDAVFLHFIGSEAKRFLLTIDDLEEVPCWGGWNWRTNGEKMRRLVFRSMPGETQDLEIGLFHGRGNFDISGITLTEHFFSKKVLSIKIPNRIFPRRFMYGNRSDQQICFQNVGGFDQLISVGNKGFEMFGISYDAGRYGTLTVSDALGEPGIPVPADGSLFMGKSGGDIYVKFQAYDSMVLAPEVNIRLWRDNHNFVNFPMLEDSAYFVATGNVPDSNLMHWEFFDDGQWKTPEILDGFGFFGLRGGMLGDPGSGSDEAVLNIREYYEQKGGTGKIRIRLMVAYNEEFNPGHGVDVFVDCVARRGSNWSYVGELDPPGTANFTHRGGVQTQHHTHRFLRPLAQDGEVFEILEYEFDPAIGKGTYTFNS